MAAGAYFFVVFGRVSKRGGVYVEITVVGVCYNREIGLLAGLFLKLESVA